MVLPEWNDLTTEEKLNAKDRYNRLKDEINKLSETVSSSTKAKRTRKRKTTTGDE